MALLQFGQPVGTIIQLGYTVADLERGMEDYTATLGVGPWFLRGPFTPPEGHYRGQPVVDVRLTLARGFAGHMMIELIEQHDELPSVWRETVLRRGHGFHHWAIASRSFDDDLQRHRARGYEIAFSDRGSTGARVVYLDPPREELPGMIELVEFTEAQEQLYTRMYCAALSWDGSEPVRRLAEDGGR